MRRGTWLQGSQGAAQLGALASQLCIPPVGDWALQRPPGAEWGGCHRAYLGLTKSRNCSEPRFPDLSSKKSGPDGRQESPTSDIL